jgi:hypothetical protein
MAKTRSTCHYIAREKVASVDKETGKEYFKPIALIDAATKQQARAHLSHKTHSVEYATQKDLFEAAKAGLEPEKAGEEESESGE